MNNVKRILSFICVIAICFTLMASPSAHAAGLLGGQAGGAWLAAGLVALNIVAHTGAQAIGSYFGWQEAPSTQSIMDYAFPNTSQVISNYMNASTIKVTQGVTTIDGVEYDELWLGSDWSQALKTNLFDFKTKWEILSGNTGTLASGAGYYDRIPLYNVNGKIRSQGINLPLDYSSYNFLSNMSVKGWPSGVNAYLRTTWPDGTENQGYDNVYSANSLSDVHLEVDNWSSVGIKAKNTKTFSYGPSNFIHHQAFQYDYVSGIVPAEPEDIPDNYGISLKIPHDKLETFYNTYPQYNVDNTVINISEDQIDIDELTNAIFDLIESMDEIKANWTSGEEPEPPAPVDPIDNINENVDTITEYQQNMDSQVSHMHQDVESIYQTQQQQQQTQQEMQETQQQIKESNDSIDDTLQDIKDSLEPGEITEKTFDLRELFPFCIPFDIYHLLQKFDGSPSAPHVQIPIVIPSIGFSYTMDLDFSAWDPVATIMRTVELIVYALGLAWATSKVIKW